MKKIITTIMIVLMMMTNVNASSSEFKRIVKITNKTELIKLSKSKKSDVLEAVAKNPNTPPKVLEKLAKSKNKWVRTAVAENPNTPPKVLEKLSSDVNDVLMFLAMNPNTPPKVLEKLAEKGDQTTKLMLIDNPHVTIEVLHKFAKSGDEVLSFTARDRFKSIRKYVLKIEKKTNKLDMFLERSKNVPKPKFNFKDSVTIYDLRDEPYTKNFYDRFTGKAFTYDSVNSFGDEEFKYLKAETAVYLLTSKESDEDKIRLLTSKYKYAIDHGGDFHYTNSQTFYLLPGGGSEGALAMLMKMGMMAPIFNINIGDITNKRSKINYSVDAETLYVNLTAYLGNNESKRKDMRRNILLSTFIFNKGYEAEIFIKKDKTFIATGYDLRAYYLLPKFYDLLKKGDEDAARILTFLAKKQYDQIDKYILSKRNMKTVFDGVSKNILK